LGLIYLLLLKYYTPQKTDGSLFDRQATGQVVTNSEVVITLAPMFTPPILTSAPVLTPALEVSTTEKYSHSSRKFPHLRKAAPPPALQEQITHFIPPTDWYEKLILDLKGQILLKGNVLSKEFLWKHYTLNASLYDPRKHALIYLGWVAFWNMEEYAMTGGPAGEFIIWGDFVTALAALGYQLTFVNKMVDLWIYLKADPNKYDIIITDYDGLGTAENIGHFPLYHCRYYLIDGFGTQEKFNVKRHLDLKRILTPYPFDGSNSAINLVTSMLPYPLWSKRKMQGVLWSKDPSFITGHMDLIRFLTSKLNITLVTTFRAVIDTEAGSASLKEIKSYPNIVFLSFLSRVEYLQLLSSSMFLIGFGRPLDGPTPLEAMAHGCAFINPLFVTPFVHHNKPTRYPYRSQHPFVQDHVPEPHAFTIDIMNHTALAETIKKITRRFQEREEFERQGKGFRPSSDHTPDEISAFPEYSYRHPWHVPARYVQNIHEILSRTAEPKCLSKYSRNESLLVPTKHPGNNVYKTFTHFKEHRCQGSCQTNWIHLEDSSKELLHSLLNNQSQRSKVLLGED
jgi:hypothetical protein